MSAFIQKILSSIKRSNGPHLMVKMTRARDIRTRDFNQLFASSRIDCTRSYDEYFQAVAAANDSILRRQNIGICLLYTSPSPRDRQKSRMPSSA